MTSAPMALALATYMLFLSCSLGLRSQKLDARS